MSNTMMSLDDLKKTSEKLGASEVILDVRRADEFAQGHIKGALNIPVDQVAGHVEELKKYARVFIHCKRGGRAKTAFDLLAGAGLTNLTCISEAGMDQWIERGYPTQH